MEEAGWSPAQRCLIRTFILERFSSTALARCCRTHASPLRSWNEAIAEIVNNCASDPRARRFGTHTASALICAPLRAGQRTVGIIALANTGRGASYSAADLKLLNTIALQTAAAIANSLLCAEMVDAARARAAFAAELHAASTVQQLLLQSASRPTPGFQVESVYLPASEVGGDFFFVSSAPDGSLTAIVGDVSGKGSDCGDARGDDSWRSSPRDLARPRRDSLRPQQCADRARPTRLHYRLLHPDLTLRRIHAVRMPVTSPRISLGAN